MKRIVSIVILIIAITAAATAQNGRTKFATDMYQAKHEMIIQELGLTQTQQKQFKGGSLEKYNPTLGNKRNIK